jgi:O-acetyl-ADP-ribose deacetylase (regulator of RNase III)
LIESASGDILKADVDAMVNPVNCEGETGRGLALQFKTRFPENFDAYYEACRNQQVRLGSMLVHDYGVRQRPRFIVNFPIKNHWRDATTLETIEEGMAALARVVEELDIATLAMPPIGCGPGGLDWKDVRPIVEKRLDRDDKHFIIYGFSAPPIQKAPTRPQEPPAMTRGRAALVHLTARYIASINDNHVTLPELHMLLYLLQEAGEVLRLEFNKGSSSPYARNLRPVLNAIDGYHLSGYIGGPDRPNKELVLIPSIEPVAAEFLQSEPDTLKRIDRVLALADGFAPHTGLELLSTTHWIATREQSFGLDELVRRTYGWNRQKKSFSPEDISQAVTRLVEQGWMEPFSSAKGGYHPGGASWASDPTDEF